MSKKLMTAILGSALALGLGGWGAGASAELTTGENQIFYQNYENLYTASGQLVTPGTPLVIGDYLVGIINIQNITVGGNTTFFSGPTNQLTGFFIQQITAVGFPDPFDPTQTTLPHVTLSGDNLLTPTTWCAGADCFSTAGLINPGEMFVLFTQTGAGTTVFTAGGPLSTDFANATDGNLYVTLGYTCGLDGCGTNPAISANDSGYAYSHPNLFGTLANFTGEAFFGLDSVRNLTGITFGCINDPNETELGGPPSRIAVTCNQCYGTSEFELNTIQGSPWQFQSNDPFVTSVTVPEPGSLALLGLGLGALGFFGSKRRKSLAN
jgi:hypothetical protein